MSAEDIRAMAERMLRETKDHEKFSQGVDDLFEQFDANESGTLEFNEVQEFLEEFLSRIVEKEVTLRKKLIRKQIKKSSDDGDNTVSRDEFPVLVKRFGKRVIHLMFLEADRMEAEE